MKEGSIPKSNCAKCERYMRKWRMEKGTRIYRTARNIPRRTFVYTSAAGNKADSGWQEIQTKGPAVAAARPYDTRLVRLLNQEKEVSRLWRLLFSRQRVNFSFPGSRIRNSRPREGKVDTL